MGFGFKDPGDPVSVNLINNGPVSCCGLCLIGVGDESDLVIIDGSIEDDDDRYVHHLENLKFSEEHDGRDEPKPWIE
jgi:hypothetical protein